MEPVVGPSSVYILDKNAKNTLTEICWAILNPQSIKTHKTSFKNNEIKFDYLTRMIFINIRANQKKY